MSKEDNNLKGAIVYFKTVRRRNHKDTQLVKYYRLNRDGTLTCVDPVSKSIREHKSFGSTPFTLLGSTKRTFDKAYNEMLEYYKNK